MTDLHIRVRALLDSVTGRIELNDDQIYHLARCRLCQDSLKLLMALEQAPDQPPDHGKLEDSTQPDENPEECLP